MKKPSSKHDSSMNSEHKKIPTTIIKNTRQCTCNGCGRLFENTISKKKGEKQTSTEQSETKVAIEIIFFAINFVATITMDLN